MKKLLISLLLLVLTLPLKADWLQYDADRRVPFLSNGAYTRDDYHWALQNTGEPSRLFLNGVYQSSEYGTNDANVLNAWACQPNGIPIGVVDINNAHGNRVKYVAGLVSQAQIYLSGSIRLYPDDVAVAISNFVSSGFKIIVVTDGAGNHLGVSNACRYAESSNALVVCSVPNAAMNIDTSPDYPSSWAHEFANILPVTMTDRNGNLYGVAAWGTNTVGAPARNIVFESPLVYTSGTSYAAPLAAGIASLLIKRFENQSVSAYRQAIVTGTHTLSLTRRLDALKVLSVPLSCLSISGNVITVNGLSEWLYSIEHSTNLWQWTVITNLYGGESMTVTQEGFYRSKP